MSKEKTNQCAQAYVCKCSGDYDKCVFGIKSGHLYAGKSYCKYFTKDEQCHCVVAKE